MKAMMKDYSKHSMRFDFDEVKPERESRLLIKSLTMMEEQLKQSDFFIGIVFCLLFIIT